MALERGIFRDLVSLDLSETKQSIMVDGFTGPLVVSTQGDVKISASYSPRDYIFPGPFTIRTNVDVTAAKEYILTGTRINWKDILEAGQTVTISGPSVNDDILAVNKIEDGTIASISADGLTFTLSDTYSPVAQSRANAQFDFVLQVPIVLVEITTVTAGQNIVDVPGRPSLLEFEEQGVAATIVEVAG